MSLSRDAELSKLFNATSTEPFGAAVDFDLREPLDPARQAELRTLLFDRQLLVFRNQRLTPDEQARVIDCLAPVRRTREGMHNVSNDVDQGVLGKGELPFHSDASFLPAPRTVLSLHAIDVVDGESSTKWASARIALHGLPPSLRARIEGRNAIQVLPDAAYTDRASSDRIPEWVPHHAHPAIMTHPETGEQILYMMEMQTVHMEGMPPAESKALIEEVLSHVYTPDNLVEHVWRNGDLVIWDNIGTQHARGSLTGLGRRTLQKVQGGGQSFEDWPWYHSPDLQRLLAVQSGRQPPGAAS